MKTQEVEITKATVVRKTIIHKRTGDMIYLQAIIEPTGDGGYFICYSHAPRQTEVSRAYFSDSLTVALDLDEALTSFDVMASLIENAFEVVVWT